MADVVEPEKAPVYLRIRQALRERIERGDYAPGTALPSENDLAEEFGTARLTVRRAMDALAAEGVVRRAQGKGVFVAGGLLDPAGAARGGFRETASILGLDASVRILSRSRRYAGDYYGWLFGVGQDDLLYSIRRLNVIDGEPVSLENTLIPLALFPEIEDVDIQVFSLYETYGRMGHAVAKTQEKLDVIELTARDAGLLGLGAGSPALMLECVSYDAEGRAIECARNLARGDRGGYSFDY